MQQLADEIAVLDKSLKTASRRPFWSGTKISQESISKDEVPKKLSNTADEIGITIKNFTILTDF